MKLGNVRRQLDDRSRLKFLQSHNISRRDGDCRRCFAAPVCGGTCYHESYTTYQGRTEPVSTRDCLLKQQTMKSALRVYVSLTPEQIQALESVFP